MTEKELDKLYSLSCMERMKIRYSDYLESIITRVPGGWIIEFQADEDDGPRMTTTGTTFVPYSDEFLPSKQLTVHKKIFYTK